MPRSSNDFIDRQLCRRNPDNTRNMLDQQLFGERNSLVPREPSKVCLELLKIPTRTLTRPVVQKLANQGKFRCFGDPR